MIESAFNPHTVSTVLHHVADGGEVLALLRRERLHDDAPRPHLILLDLNMPRVDGRQVLAAVKADDSLSRPFPIVVFTTSAAAEDILDSYGAHANAYVTKPIDLDNFDHVLAEMRNYPDPAQTASRQAGQHTPHAP